MGLMNLMGILETDLPLEEKLKLHLVGNCYPPVPTELHPVCLTAIHLVSDGKPDVKISLPIGFTYKGGETEAPAYAVVENFHLDLFVEYKDEEGDEDG